MDLNENADLDPSQVEDLRGSGGGGLGRGLGRGGLGGLPIPMPGGKLGLIITAIVILGSLVLGGGYGTGLLGGGDTAGQGDNTDLSQRCGTANPNRFDDADCRNLLYINSIQAYWRTAAPQALNVTYQTATTRFFSGVVSTGCGQADSGVGPFYCPADQHVYIDLTFYDELANRFGAKGQFAQAYVLAHEYGHHLQALTGIEPKVRQLQQRDPASTNRYSVMLELQADCLAGAWARNAADTTDRNGQALFRSVTQQDVSDAVETAGAIGDDTIQRQSTGQINPDKFTHGTSEQRKQWFLQGYNAGTPAQCGTFNGALSP